MIAASKPKTGESYTAGKTSIHVEHYRMRSFDDVEPARAFWKVRLARLDKLLKEQ